MTDQLSTLPPKVSIHAGKAITTSRDVAAYFSKRHERVIDKIRNLECSPYFTEHNFVLSEYTDCTGRKLTMYEMTKDGFIFLVMGFTGKKAAAFKEAYISEFNRMESELTKPSRAIDPHPIPRFRYLVTLTYKDRLTGEEKTFTGGANNPGEIVQGTAKRFGYYVTEMLDMPVAAYY